MPHIPDVGSYVPAELAMFADPVPQESDRVGDFGRDRGPAAGRRLLGAGLPPGPRATGKEVLLEVLGFWRKSSAERHLERLRQHAKVPFLLAVSDQLHIEDAELEGLPAGIHRFRQMPLPDEVARLADAALNDASEKRRYGPNKPPTRAGASPCSRRFATPLPSDFH